MEEHVNATTKTRIATLNDLCRRTLGTIFGRMVLTQGIAALPSGTLTAVLVKVQEYDSFPPGDDPYGERDFGAFEHAGSRILWKIDYYDPQLEGGSQDPADPAQTERVLTIMLASE